MLRTVERLIEERAQGDLDFIVLALARPGEVRGDLAACLTILKAAVQIVLTELQRINAREFHAEECPRQDHSIPIEEIEL